MTFEEVVVPEGADEAGKWAAVREHELRHERMRLTRMGVAEILSEAAEAIKGFHLALAGDKSLPEIDPERLEAYRQDTLLLDEERGW